MFDKYIFYQLVLSSQTTKQYWNIWWIIPSWTLLRGKKCAHIRTPGITYPVKLSIVLPGLIVSREVDDDETQQGNGGSLLPRFPTSIHIQVQG